MIAVLRLLTPHSSLLTPHFFTRCVNCGNIEDPVILLNRWHGQPTHDLIARTFLADFFKTLTR